MHAKIAKLLLGGVIAATSLTAFGGPLQRGDVANDPAWVLHIDFDGLRPTDIGQYLLSEMEKPEAQAKLAAFQALFSFDLRTQLHGVTLYCTGTRPEEGVLLVYAQFDPERLTTLAKAAKDSQNTPYKTHVIYNWIDDNRKGKGGASARTYAAIAGKRVIFGQREQQVARALDVLDGASPNLASGSVFPELGAPGDTSFIEAAARKLDLPESDPHAAMFRLSKLIRLQVGQTQGQITATLNLKADSDEVAGQMAAIGQGLVALMKLQKDKPESAKLAEALTLKQDGALVTVNLTLPANTVVDIMKADAARKAKKSQKD